MGKSKRPAFGDCTISSKVYVMYYRRCYKIGTNNVIKVKQATSKILLGLEAVKN